MDAKKMKPICITGMMNSGLYFCRLASSRVIHTATVISQHTTHVYVNQCVNV